MAVIKISILTVIKAGCICGKVFYGFPDAHYLQSLFGADAGGCFEIPLKRS